MSCFISQPGFGPFGEHRVNASWAAVQEMTKLDLPDDLSLIPLEIPVEYKAVDKLVPFIWEKYKPDVSIVGFQELILCFLKGLTVVTESLTTDVICKMWVTP